jgi:SAM-dependent methyltransferase
MQRTDWDRYYRQPMTTARFSRQLTQRVLLRLIRQFAVPADSAPMAMVELGGANSCFLDRILRDIAPSEYHILDNNAYGLDLVRQRLPNEKRVVFHEDDALNPKFTLQADMIFSIGLIEHFDVQGTRRVVRTHFDLLKPGGVAIISCPTPTWPYRACRGAAELLGCWHFPDERPLLLPEVMAAVQPCGAVLHHQIVWGIVLTQLFVVARKAFQAAPTAAA